MSRQVVITCEHGKFGEHDIRDENDWIRGFCPGDIQRLDLDSLPSEMIEAAAWAMNPNPTATTRVIAEKALRAGLSAMGGKP